MQEIVLIFEIKESILTLFFYNLIFPDRTILVWYLKDLSKTKDRKTFRINIDFDHAYKLLWSPDSKAILILKEKENTIEAYKLEKKDSFFTSYSKGVTFPNEHADEVIGFGIALDGKFIMSCTNHTEMILWDARGNVLDRIDTFLMSTNCAKVSPCGNLIAAGGFAPDVKVWVVKFKNGEYLKTEKAFDLTGHRSGVWDIAFDEDASHLASVCKDGHFRVFKINGNFINIIL